MCAQVVGFRMVPIAHVRVCLGAHVFDRQGLLVYGSALRLCERLERLRIRSLLDQGANPSRAGPRARSEANA